jgi:hypothetical protein
MRLLAGLVKRNILTQLVLPGVYVWQTALLLATHLTRPASTGALVCMPPGSSSCPMLARAAVGWCGARILHNITIPVYLRLLTPPARPAVEARL